MFERNVEWSVPETIEFITLVEEKPEIYDHSRPGHFDEHILDECWRQISKNFTNTLSKKIVEVLKSEWQLLKDSYYQERHGTMHGNNELAKSEEQLKKLEYRLIYSNCLQFLEPHANSCDLCNFNSLAEETEADADMSGDNQSVDEEMSCKSSSLNYACPNETSSDTKKRKYLMSELDSTMFCCLKNKMVKQEQSKTKPAIALFFDSLVDDMEQLTPEQLRKFKVDVLTALNNLLKESN